MLVENTIETLGFVDVAIDPILYLFRRITEEVVGLALCEEIQLAAHGGTRSKTIVPASAQRLR